MTMTTKWKVLPDVKDMETVRLSRELDVLALGIAHNVVSEYPINRAQTRRFRIVRDELRKRADLTSKRPVKRNEGESYGDYVKRCLNQ